MVLLLGVYSTFELLKDFKVRIPGIFLTMHLIFLLAENIFNLLGKVVWPKPDQLDWFRCPWCY